MSMVEEHQQLLAKDATYWKLRIDKLKKPRPLNIGKLSKNKKTNPEFGSDCNTLLSEVHGSSPLPPSFPTMTHLLFRAESSPGLSLLRTLTTRTYPISNLGPKYIGDVGFSC
ncbi:hypothetical protein BKA70DRAFT_1426450 [Coprinopsis sp. MPI-PUGE-AT-0042]|nr:hypothetical protein BKA70DRAFT_1426450 [Coprinopsis sp. MPI-PUGE-AT-0042]